MERDFLEFIRTTKMSKSYKIPTIMAFFAGGKIRQSVSAKELVDFWREYYNDPKHEVDMQRDDSTRDWRDWDDDKLFSLIERNPIKYLSESEWFSYEKENKQFSLDSLELQKLIVETNRALADKERQYFSRYDLQNDGNLKNRFEEWLESKSEHVNSGKNRSNVKALVLCSEPFRKHGYIDTNSIFEISSAEKIGELRRVALEEQKKQGGFLHNDKLPGYDQGHYSSALKNYREFLEFIMKPVELEEKLALVQQFTKAVKNANLVFSQELSARFIASLCAKPFVILTGLSGSGKTKIAQAFSQWICADEKQMVLVPVGADWTNREPLLGYPNALAPKEYVKPDNGILDLLIEAAKTENSHKPYFLILDEMNLSHVERYFADFLSAMESGGHIHLHEGETWGDVPANITLPKNLFIIGTVNIDETTYMFSPKVLDRANVIEFRLTENDLEGFLDNLAKPDMASLRAHGATMAGDFVTAALSDENKFSDTDYLRTVLLKFFSELKKIGAEFGYRSAYEISRFCGTLQQLSPDEGDFRDKDRMLDAAIIQKLLPKIHGSRKKLEPVFAVLIKLCLADSALDADSNLLSKLEQSPDEISNSDKVRFKLSLEKLLRMKKRAIQDGFTSFAEA